MREILFRAKKIENGAWVEGDLIQLSEDDDYWYILPDGVSGEMYEKQSYHFRENDVMCEVALAYVDKDTVSEYTGLRDKNGKHIFEGDLLKITSTVFGGIIEQQTQKREDIALVEYDSKTGGYRLKVYHNGKYKRISKFTKNHLWAYDAEVIGNKWDNPELLEG